MSPDIVSALWLPASALLWILGLGWIFALLPNWSRAGLAFAVSVAPGFADTAAGREIVAGYRRGVAAVTALAAGAWLATLAFDARFVGGVHLLLLPEIGGFTVVYLRARRATLHHAVEHPAGEPVPAARAALPGGRLGQAAPFAILVAVSAWILGRMGSLPAEIPIHYGAHLEADQWVAPTWPHLLALPLVGIATCAGMLLMSWAMARHTRSPAGPRQARTLRLTLRILLGASLMVAGLFGGFSLLILQGAERLDPLVLVAAIAVPEVAGLALLVWVLVRFSRLQATAPDAPGDRTEDRHWKTGLVYFNPGDPALFVEKRFGIGYTMNMARPASWWLLAAVVLLPLLVVLLLRLLT